MAEEGAPWGNISAIQLWQGLVEEAASSRLTLRWASLRSDILLFGGLCRCPEHPLSP